MMKYTNYIILFVLLFSGVLLKEHIHISTNLLSLFATQESLKKLHIANSLGYSKELLIAVKGFDRVSKKKVRHIVKELRGLQHISVVKSTIVPSKAMQEYYKRYYPILATFKDTNETKESLHKSLKSLYDAEFTNVFYTNINKNDPLELFTLKHLQQNNLSHKGDYITLGNYGYLIRAMSDVSPSDMSEAKELYKEIKRVLKPYKDIVAFAPFFYTVENSKAIQADVSWIVALSTIVLLIIYFFLLRNIKLLSHTLMALLSSMLFASLVSTIVFVNFSVLSLAFGMSLTAVSIDYLLHYHFHNFYQTTQKIDKNVLYGYLTTISAFMILAFIPIPIIAQISFFALLSLSFAYLLFTFVFPELDIKAYEETHVQTTKENHIKNISSSMIFLLSLMLLLISTFNFKLDTNIKNLDYNNTNLVDAQKIFQDNSTSNLYPLIVEATTENKLLLNLNKLKKSLPESFSLASFVVDKKSCLAKQKILKNHDFKRLNSLIKSEADKIGFKKEYFKDAYLFAQNLPSCNAPNLEIFKEYGLYVYKDRETYYTIALVSDAKKAQNFEFVSSINVKELLHKSAQTMYENLLIFGAFVMLIILLLLLFSVKKRFIYALNYVLFPSSFTLAILSLFYTINIMHLFSLIILVAIGIDYGIYMSNSHKPHNTMVAIKYSLLSTFAAFGVLIFSTITALNSIGIVISLGSLAIFILIKGMK